MNQADSDSERLLNRPYRRYEYSLTHGFYASMGGYVFDLLDDDGVQEGPPFLPAGRTRMTITSLGVHFLMKHAPNLIPDVPKTSITDRSKASSLSKAILLAQVTWFCTNGAGRLGQGLPLSLLEVTTVAHGLCTLVTYALWWAKPLNIAEPTVIRGMEARKACALMLMCSPDAYHMLFGTVSITFPPELAFMTILDAGGPPPGAESESLISTSQVLTSSTTTSQTVPLVEVGRMSPLREQKSVSLAPEVQCLYGTNFTPRRQPISTPWHSLKSTILYRPDWVPWYAKRRGPDHDRILEPEDVHRWRLAYDAMGSYELTLERVTEALPEKPYVSLRSTLQSSADFKGKGLSAIVRSNLFATMLTMVYGTPHFLGWNTRFPTLIERTLWRVATAATTFWGAGMASVVALIVIVRKLMHNFTGERRGEAGLVAVAASLYIITAGYLLLESLRQLLFLEPATYQLPAWSNYWPHFS